MTSMPHGCLSFNRFNSCGLLLKLVCFPSAGCFCQVTLKCSCLLVSVSVSYQFRELDTHQIICIWIRMDLGYENVYKNLSLSILSSVPLCSLCETVNLFFSIGKIIWGADYWNQFGFIQKFYFVHAYRIVFWTHLWELKILGK